MTKKLLPLIVAGLLLVAAVASAQYGTMKGEMHGAMSAMMMTRVTKAVAVLHPTAGNDVTGTVTFTQEDNGVLVEANLTGLSPGKHGFHIHEFGDCSAADGTSAGGHFNPEGNPHAGPEAEVRHIGDLGNIVADQSGAATFEWLDPNIRLNGPASILGRGVIVHAGEDDLTSQPTGAAGARVACGVIGVAQNGVTNVEPEH